MYSVYKRTNSLFNIHEIAPSGAVDSRVIEIGKLPKEAEDYFDNHYFSVEGETISFSDDADNVIAKFEIESR